MAVTIVAAMLWTQAGYAGIGEPVRALSRPGTMGVIRLSLFTATVAAALGMVLAVPSAYALSRLRFPGRILVDTLLDVPVVLSPIAVGITLLLFFRTAPGGWIETHMVRFVFEVPGIILAQFIIASAVQIRLLKAAFGEIPPRLELVARYLGCGPWEVMRRVTLPLAKRGLMAAFVLGWGRAIGEYGATVTIAGSMRGKTETIPSSIVLNWSAVRIEEAVGLVMLLTAIAVGVLLVVRLAAGRGA